MTAPALYEPALVWCRTAPVLYGLALVWCRTAPAPPWISEQSLRWVASDADENKWILTLTCQACARVVPGKTAKSVFALTCSNALCGPHDCRHD